MGDWGGDWQGPSAATSSGLVLAQSAVAVPHTGDTNETILATIAVPANAIGKNGQIAIRSLNVSFTNSANNKTTRVRFGAAGSGLSGTQVANAVVTTSAQALYLGTLANRNNTGSQIFSQFNLLISTSGSGLSTAAIDTTAATELNITGQLALGSETITLESYQVILYPKS